MKLNFEKALLYIAGALVSVIVLGTVIGFVTGKAHPAYGLRRADPSPSSVTSANKNEGIEVDAFTEIGELRSGTKPSENGDLCSISIKVWFSYPAGDTAFYEELCQKKRQITAIITEYFLRHTKQELLQKGELSVKNELKQEINDRLVLGKILGIYFDEYFFWG